MSRAELIATLFQEADELPEAERAAFLDARTAGDASLRAELERLLQSSALAACHDSQWEAGAIANLPTAPEPADAFAAHGGFESYQLLECIGAGGMGTVYKAMRAGQGIQQIVAVKILHTAPRDPAAAMRFEQECRILARLEHPNIARMLDAGVTPDGRPFLSMEYVDGVPLSVWAEANKPGPREVLRLFQGICAAVSHTHHNLVVHRDLKPGNVLVTAEGVPKLVDFGIATLSDGSAMRTRTGAGALTPEYASPEQIQGEPAGTASDIYSLGVLLYQMLAGQLPYRAESGPMALARAITLHLPVPFRARGVRIETDLELVVLKALRKEPRRRCQSVEQLWADLERWQKGFPVSARRATVVYSAIKLVRRNPVWIAASLLVLGSILTGSAIAVREANRRVLDTRRFGEALIFDLADEFGNIPGTDPVRRTILQRGLVYLNALAASRGNDRALALEIAEAFRRLADLQGLNQVNLGDWRGAYASLQKSEAILAPFAAANPGDIEVGKRLAGVYTDAADMLTGYGDLYAARDYARKAVTLSERLVALKPADREVRGLLSDSWEATGSLLGNPALPNFGDVSGAMAAYRKSLTLQTALAGEDPNVDARQPLAGDWTREARVWFYSLGDRQKALERYRRAAEISEWIQTHSDRNRWRDFNVAVRNENLVEPLLAEGSVAEARRRADDALTTLTALDAKDAGVAAFRKEVAMALRVRGTVDAATGRHAAALGLYRRALAGWRGLGDLHVEYANDPGYRDLWRVTADSQLAAGDPAGGHEIGRRGDRHRQPAAQGLHGECQRSGEPVDRGKADGRSAPGDGESGTGANSLGSRARQAGRAAKKGAADPRCRRTPGRDRTCDRGIARTALMPWGASPRSSFPKKSSCDGASSTLLNQAA